jgi:type I restriction enzyme S subunit
MNKKSPSPRAKAPERSAVKVIEASSSAEDAALEQEAPAALVPKLRFPEFRDTGEWVEKPLREAALINPANKGLPELFVYIDLESVDAGQLKAKTRIYRSGAPSRAQRIVRQGDIIYQIVRPYQRNNLLCEFDDEEDYVASTGYAQLRAKVDNRFLYQLIHTDLFVGRVMEKCTGSNYPAINSSDLAEIKLPLAPSPPEQQRIADCLTSLDELIAAQGRKLDALKTHKSGLMQRLFPREGETVPSLRFPEFQDDEDWENLSISDLGQVITGSTPSTTQPKFYGGGIPFVSPADISDLRFVDKTKTTLTAEGFEETRPIRAGSILFVCIGSTIGKVAQNVRACATNQQINAVIPSAKHTSDFVYFVLSNASHRIALLAGKQAVPIVNKSLFSSVRLLVPKRPEQQRIADCLSSLDELIAAEGQKLDALKTHKKGLMQQLFPTTEESL